MTALRSCLGLVIVGAAMAASASAQIAGSAGSPSLQPPVVPGAGSSALAIPVPTATPAVQLLRNFQESDVKFDMRELMDLLRDRRHEGWVLAAYPDPKTGQPLIGAGVSLDLPARPHPQRDPLNPNPFLEPSSAELWQAAGLPPEKLNEILADFHSKLNVWNMREYRRHIRDLDTQISDDEATQLLRIAAVQAILNAKAYCRHFDQLTAHQQMALSQLAFQMGINLEQFSQFLGMINSDTVATPITRTATPRDVEYWRAVQKSLVQSQWARLYRIRATAVIAMLDPRYHQNPTMAERRIGATLRPAVIHRHRVRSAGKTELASAHKSTRGHAGKNPHRARTKRKA